jgi:hypothetical protein
LRVPAALSTTALSTFPSPPPQATTSRRRADMRVMGRVIRTDDRWFMGVDLPKPGPETMDPLLLP